MGERSVHHLLENSARLHPQRTALIHDSERVSYGRLNQEANCLASFLRQQGVTAGERVALLLENSLCYVVSYYGILKAGAVAVPLNPELKAEGLGELLRDLEPRMVIVSRKAEHALRESDPDRLGISLVLVQDPALAWSGGHARILPWEDALEQGGTEDPGQCGSPDRLASIIYTSGSTGKPKGVMLSHRNIVANTDSIVAYLGLTEQDIQMVVLPFFYVMGKSLLNTHVAVGGTVVLNNNFAYPASVIAQMASERVTGFSGVPATYAYLLHRSPLAAFRDRLSELRYCTQAGGHMSRQIKEQLIEALPPHTRLFVMYGATEAAARLSYVEPERLREKMESIGRPIPGVTIRVVDDQGREVARGESGELVASGANIMQGYWRDREATARALDHNGYHTGDLGYQDADGYLYVTGRKDDLLKVGGHRIDPQEIEDALMASGLLLEVAVLGVQDELLGKRLVALAVPLDPATTAGTLLAGCLDRLPRHKLPGEVRFVQALPKYPSSKVDRPGCLALFHSPGADAGSERPAPPQPGTSGEEVRP
ncbi:AMP-dependent synthetase and ligase [Geomonas silvestris]|uniref:AMP-dependent synthetase and ligase n=1 Tax=Geomonas silvestris TaxID=2740184 RepID=A0A6V8MNX4_9BACT|nr:class I adenylate-forming enzyme family protein [Geomonas silvestris]GFO61691.1 AMP-dependent synthetase and ligase [Geomonas silvestris]